MTYAFEAEGLVKRFGTTTALAGIDLAARRGTVLGVLGPNGAGKTTAVRILATLLRPDSGRATVGGHDVVREAAEVRRLIGLTGQYASVDEDLTGTQNLVLIGRLLDLSRREARARAAELLAWFDLTEAAGRPAKTYSGGMRRRLDLAASLVGRPEVIYLDEPTTGLDPAKREEMWGVVRSLVDDGSTVLLTTQYLDEADALADEISVIDHGRVIAHGTPGELKRIAGSQTIVVRPTEPDRIGEVAEILRASTGTEPELPRPGLLTVPVEGDAPFTAVVRRLDDAGIGVAELALRLPSLDEVFFTLTGHGADEPTEVAA
ncbi:daunorubicin/doxorubicin resistance ABC transporter ATP-binding protein DrrA [Micromonospora sp. WMMA2032]|uniref:ATP-binding cassette domain-containing protein n=1 Tax=Micromonospora sp. WMMA2032 TaxID=2039870 RepID=UPI000C0587CB|nr:ATP-binding cassette domain-containing protein [Micromonospora sp. WMMA2032]ATO16995.1 daunorubicin/doxorubicin resistance ABC transporter ATP-binding protein DrrA [Micromonospora sp. WMMA2032]